MHELLAHAGRHWVQHRFNPDVRYGQGSRQLGLQAQALHAELRALHVGGALGWPARREPAGGGHADVRALAQAQQSLVEPHLRRRQVHPAVHRRAQLPTRASAVSARCGTPP